MKFGLLITALTTLSTMQLSAQSIKGKTMDAGSKQVLEFVNVALHKDGSSKIHMGMTSNLDGDFEFQSLPKGNYELKITFVG